MVFNSPCLTDKKELIHHEVEMVINSPWIMPLLGTKGLASPKQTATGVCHDSTKGLGCPRVSSYLFNKATKTANYMVLEGVLMKNKDAASSRDIQLDMCRIFKYSSQDSRDWKVLLCSYFNPKVQD
ncbi:hypothetical protein Tco_0493414 [Tanacetum coccineum]